MAAVAARLGGHGVVFKCGLGRNHQDAAALAMSLPKSAFMGLVCEFIPFGNLSFKLLVDMAFSSVIVKILVSKGSLVSRTSTCLCW